MQMNQTVQSFKMGHGQIDSGDQNDFMGDTTGKEKHVGKLQPLNHMKTPKIDERH